LKAVRVGILLQSLITRT